MTQPTVPPKSVRSPSARAGWTPSAPRGARAAVVDLIYECYPLLGLLVLGLALLRIILR